MKRLWKYIVGIFVAVFLLLPVSGLASEAASSSDDILMFKQSYEKLLKESIESVLNKTIGSNKSMVAVSADITRTVAHNTRTGVNEIIERPEITLVSVEILLDSSVARADVGNELKDAIFKIIGLPVSKMKLDIKYVKLPSSGNNFFGANKEALLILLVVIALLAFLFGPVRKIIKAKLSEGAAVKSVGPEKK